MNPSTCDEIIPLNNEIPTMFLCPITKEVMREPLFTRHGHTFERSALATWLSNHDNTCPLTRKVLQPNDLVPHYQLKSQIEAWHTVRGIDYNPRCRKDKSDSNNEDDDDYDDDDDDLVFKTSYLSCRTEDLIPSSCTTAMKVGMVPSGPRNGTQNTTHQNNDENQHPNIPHSTVHQRPSQRGVSYFRNPFRFVR